MGVINVLFLYHLYCLLFLKTNHAITNKTAMGTAEQGFSDKEDRLKDNIQTETKIVLLIHRYKCND